MPPRSQVPLPQPPQSFGQQTRAARTAARAQSRATLASRAARINPEGAAVYAAGKAQEGARAAGQARIPTGNRQYQGVILAEFLIAIIIVAVAPIATGGSQAAKAKGGLSPYDTNDLKQLVAVGGTFFVLALLSSGNHGRLAAWLGGLVVLAIGMSKAGQANLTAVLSAASGQQGTGEGGGPGTSTV